MRVALLACVALMGATVAFSDIYMHNPRGSNCRLNEANTNRNNADRLFDSQNNAKGGYCWGPALSFYEHSELSIEWTNQHGCGNPKLECNLVIQYMCGMTQEEDESIQIRDGDVSTPANTGTIPDDIAQFNNKVGENFQFGMHESFAYYQDCKTRTRNMGLFTADRNVQENGPATRTRQNNNGGRRGFECPEERDYYPYWHPTPWKDVAILTNDIKQCAYYKAESQNVAKKGRCKPEGEGPTTVWRAENNPTDCAQEGYEWEEVDAWNIPAPECVLSPWNRDNHLGNAVNGFTNQYNWTLPDSKQEACITEEAGCNCVVRIRYNISTADINGWGLRNKGDANKDGETIDGQMTDLTHNDKNSPVTQDPWVDIPFVKDGKATGQQVRLAIDTSQFGRTFQDRSHVFHIIPRPEAVGSARIWNLNVRGKRGNIVEAYPSVEYDFVPEQLNVKANDFVHFQWTGCDTNPAGNAGEGTASTDRNNLIQVPYMDMNYPHLEGAITMENRLFDDDATLIRMAFLDQDPDVCQCYKQEDCTDSLEAEHGVGNNNAIETDLQNCALLNNHPDPYFDGGLHKMNKTGTFEYMSSRNNNFTNRGQKGSLKVDPALAWWAIVVVIVASVLFAGAGVVSVVSWYAQMHPHSAIGSTLGYA